MLYWGRGNEELINSLLKTSGFGWVLVAFCLFGQSGAQGNEFCWNSYVTLADESLQNFQAHVEASEQAVAKRLAKAAHDDIPSVSQIHLPLVDPQVIRASNQGLSPGLTDPLLEEARLLKSLTDFKTLSDMNPRPLAVGERENLIENAERAATLAYTVSNHLGEEDRKRLARQTFLHSFIESAYDFGGQLTRVNGGSKPKWRVDTGKPQWDKAFDYTEEMLGVLVRSTPDHRDGSLLPSPYPVLIAAKGRFHESYYWDTYFGVKGLLATGRLELAQMQVENLLHAIRQYGIIPNGMRDYYLSRSQPPFVSSLVREVVDATLKEDPGSRDRIVTWLKERAIPLLRRDYHQFWMAQRFDPQSGLNHHSDAINFPRPERHGFDVEEELGETYRDVRASAESGLDFTALHRGRGARLATPLLNSMLYKTETDLAHLLQMVDGKGVDVYRRAANRRKEAMEKMWNAESGRYEHYDLETGTRVEGLTAETFFPLFAGMLDPKTDAARIARLHRTLDALEEPGGVAASGDRASTHQWDGVNGWAPFQVATVQGWLNAGIQYRSTAERLATKWVDTVSAGHAKHGAMFERMDLATMDKPEVDETKYPTQRGFLWTNSSYSWMLIDVLGHRPRPRAPAPNTSDKSVQSGPSPK